MVINADAAIIGCGPAGCAAAIRLAAAGARVVLVDRAREAVRKPGEIIDPAVRVPLAELGLVAPFDALASLALAGNVSLWDSDVPVESHGILNPYGMGALVDRPALEQMLQSAARRAGVVVQHSKRHLLAERKGRRWELDGDFEAASRIRASFVIEATGRANGVARRVERRATDRLIALLTYGAAAPGPQDQRLLIEASEMGWWYAAPLPRQQAVVAFLTDPDLLPSSRRDRALFIETQLRRTTLISRFAAQMLDPTPVFGCPANSSIREQIHGDTWIFVGDAASTYDPLLGKGVAMALAKGTAIARLVSSELDLRRAFSAYADAEHASFATFRADQRRTYRRSAARSGNPFWQRRCA